MKGIPRAQKVVFLILFCTLKGQRNLHHDSFFRRHLSSKLLRKGCLKKMFTRDDLDFPQILGSMHGPIFRWLVTKGIRPSKLSLVDQVQAYPKT